MKNFILFSVALIFFGSGLSIENVTLAQDQNGMCHAKDEVIQRFQSDGVHYRKVTGGDADALRTYLNKFATSGDPDPSGWTYIVFWKKGVDRALVSAFDNSNCARYLIKPPLQDVINIIGESGA